MSDSYPKPIFVSKLDAARRQLDTAICMWFKDDDPISIHTLAHASHEIIHIVSKKRKRSRDLLFDSLVVKDEYRREFNDLLKKPGNFFKHAHRDANDIIEFHPMLTELFLMTSLMGLQFAGEQLNDVECTFLIWIQLHRPTWLSEEGKRLLDSIGVEHIDYARRLSKREFFEGNMEVYALRRARP